MAAAAPTENLNRLLFQAITNTDAFRVGAVTVSSNPIPLVVDSWGFELQIVRRSSYTELGNVSDRLLGKTNAALIWSVGPNGINEHGAGDDVFLENGKGWKD